MTTKPGQVYRVDLGIGGKIRMMVVISREDNEAPRALSLCVPITTVFRNSHYEIELKPSAFLREKSYANMQGLQAIQHHELVGPIGHMSLQEMQSIREALRYAMEL
jgi:mRNA-degrading endonuclease toxin of MazEF toxin-antitoxin module